MNLPKYKLTAAHKARFSKEVQKMVEELGLFDYETIILMKKGGEDNLAACSVDTSGRLAVIACNKTWNGIKPTVNQLRLAAVHEVLELLLWELCEVHKDPHSTDEHIEKTRHAVIRRLEHYILGGRSK